MALPRFDVLLPETLQSACALLDEYSEEGVAIMAGGTDLLVDIRRPIIPAHLPRCHGCDQKTGKPIAILEKTPKYIISIARVPELKGISEVGKDRISIGSLTTITEICESSIIRKYLTALAEGGDNLGSPLVRNRGTIGGNICNARPAADALVPSIALNGELELVSAKNIRQIPIEDFIIGPGKTTINKGEILTKIFFTVKQENTGSSTIKLANRKALEISVVNVASLLTLDQKNEKIKDVKIVMGAVGPTPLIARKSADYLVGKKPSEANFMKAGEIAAGECKPITDHRGSALYRMEMVRVLVRKTLTNSLNYILRNN